MIGPDIRHMTYDNGGQDFNGKAVIMFNSMFSERGLIQFFEFDVVHPGSFKFVVSIHHLTCYLLVIFYNYRSNILSIKFYIKYYPIYVLVGVATSLWR